MGINVQLVQIEEKLSELKEEIKVINFKDHDQLAAYRSKVVELLNMYSSIKQSIPYEKKSKPKTVVRLA